MMNKETYERTELEVIGFCEEDVIMTSNPHAYEDDELALILSGYNDN